MTATKAQLEAVLSAAYHVLVARQHQRAGVAEWVMLARAVGACVGRKTTDLLTECDRFGAVLPPPLAAWDEATDGPLPKYP